MSITCPEVNHNIGCLPVEEINLSSYRGDFCQVNDVWGLKIPK